ncbi:MAG: hypothetical protein H6715_06270 [Myxococcales bacterium]|nr:hypothetical protein [Myxococcales bacterium]MCB9708073.1 hypothetical protein [Myxococcales bacterium]
MPLEPGDGTKPSRPKSLWLAGCLLFALTALGISTTPTFLAMEARDELEQANTNLLEAIAKMGEETVDVSPPLGSDELLPDSGIYGETDPDGTDPLSDDDTVALALFIKTWPSAAGSWYDAYAPLGSSWAFTARFPRGPPA